MQGREGLLWPRAPLRGANKLIGVDIEQHERGIHQARKTNSKARNYDAALMPERLAGK
jgi:hypothetical protein